MYVANLQATDAIQSAGLRTKPLADGMQSTEQTNFLSMLGDMLGEDAANGVTLTQSGSILALLGNLAGLAEQNGTVQPDGLNPVNGRKLPDELTGALAGMMQMLFQAPFTQNFADQVSEASAYLGIDNGDKTATTDMLMAMLVQQQGGSHANTTLASLMDAAFTQSGGISLFDTLQQGTSAAESTPQTASDALQAALQQESTAASFGILPQTATGLSAGMTTSGTTQTAEPTDLFGEFNMLRNMHQVKQQLSEHPESAAAVSGEVSFNDLLQNAHPVDAESMLTGEEAMAPAETQEILHQTLENLTQRLTGEADTYTIRLRPDGLGQITVNMTRTEEGKMLLNMIASSPKTADALNQELASLQAALSRHDAQVTEITVDQADTSLLYQQFNQQFGDQTNSGMPQQQARQQTYHGARPAAEESVEPAASGSARLADNSLLHRRI